MMKKLLYPLTIIALMSHPLHAWFDGLYFGVAGGVSSQRARLQTQAFFIPPTLPNKSITKETDTTLGQWVGYGALLAGWGVQYGRWFYLGMRLSGNFASYDLNQTTEVSYSDADLSGGIFTISTDSQFRLNTAEFAFDLKPGFTFHQLSMLFGIVGVSVNDNKLASEATFRRISSSPITVTETPLPTQEKEVTAAFRLGLGIEERLNETLSMHLTYIFAKYQNINSKGNLVSSVGMASAQAKPYQQTLAIGASYYF